MKSEKERNAGGKERGDKDARRAYKGLRIGRRRARARIRPMKKGRVRGEGKGPLGSGNLSDTTELARRQLPGGYKGVAPATIPPSHYRLALLLHASSLPISLLYAPTRMR